jgi:hypothetical protein
MRHGAAAFVIATAICASLSVSPARIGEMPSAHAQDSSFWSFLKQGQTIQRCAPMSPAHSEAKAGLQRFSDRMLRPSDADPLPPVLDELYALLKSECFWMASETGRVPAPDSTLSLKEWWSQGGDSWLDSYLELPRQGEISAMQPHIIVPPDTRRTLNLETTRGHRLQSLLCSQKDAACGARTRGWVLRADVHFESVKPPSWRDSFDRQQFSGEQASRECLARAGQNYQTWRACVESRRRTRAALPLGEFRAPDSGWLIVAGRRGHYDFCDTVRAYDLETGTAFMSDSCSGLALERDGTVNVPDTNNRRKETVRSGVISIENLREAVWMMLFKDEAAEIQLLSDAVPLPRGLTPEITIDNDGMIAFGGASANTGQTLLVWRWIPTGQTRFDGELTWPGSDEAAEDHAATLLQVADKSFVEGCPRRSLPSSASIRARQPVNRVDGPGESVDKWLEKAIPQWSAIPICH